tara:strand:- start:73069 stop:73680 length:612 start_codon:yes stop_codon:yes gene_type:complete
MTSKETIGGNNRQGFWGVVILITILLSVVDSIGQSHFGFEKQKEYLYAQFEIDPGGSLDKEGFNSVFTIGGTGLIGYKGIPVDISVALQTIYTNKGNETSAIVRDYMDWAVQLQVTALSYERWDASIGLGGGMIHRDVDGSLATAFYRGIAQVNYHVSKRVVLTISTTLDYASDLPEDERRELTIPGHRYSGRFGLRYLLTKF